MKMLVGTKADRNRAVSVEEGREVAERFGAGFVECSSRTRECVREPFDKIVEEIVRDEGLLQRTKRKTIQNQAVEQEMGQGCMC